MILPAHTWVLRHSSLATEGCASSSGCRLVGWEPGRSSHAKVDFRSLVELQLPGVCFNVLGELPILGRGASFGRPMRGEFLSFAITSFHSSIGSPIVDTCTKAVVRGAICRLDTIPLTIKLAIN
ncbi:hypothetical protein B296_00040561 [Ensete ventricosum]|uniref:Uncharacterized protein n=1 Tax=Ensete ventricosum TaxID=4639 RepID=A0A426Y4U7_ENSVE|nr:hypothetical protein B296_00040561 [Ensete ventricosum]